jgi:hypothetical protein
VIDGVSEKGYCSHIYRVSNLLLTHSNVKLKHVKCQPSAHASMRQHASAYVSIRQHTSAYVSIRQHTSGYALRCRPLGLSDESRVKLRLNQSKFLPAKLGNPKSIRNRKILLAKNHSIRKNMRKRKVPPTNSTRKKTEKFYSNFSVFLRKKRVSGEVLISPDIDLASRVITTFHSAVAAVPPLHCS